MTNRKYYAWVGQNAATGTPNPLTGNMSMYGTNHVFSDKKERDEFVEDYRPSNPSAVVISCTKRELRRRNLGMPVWAYEEDLHHSETARVEDDEGRIDWVRI